MIARTFTHKFLSALLLVTFISETCFIAPALAAMNLPYEEFGLEKIEMLISENAHLACDEIGMDIQIPVNTMVSFATEIDLTSKTATTGMEVPLRVVYDVIIDGQVVIPAGSAAIGRVLEAKKAKIFGKPGHLAIGVESISMQDGFIPMHGSDTIADGDSRAVVSWVCFGVSFIILWPLIFVPFCIKGKQAEIAAGTRLSAYTGGQVSPNEFVIQ